MLKELKLIKNSYVCAGLIEFDEGLMVQAPVPCVSHIYSILSLFPVSHI